MKVKNRLMGAIEILKYILCFIGAPLMILALVLGTIFIEAPKIAYEFYEDVIKETINKGKRKGKK